MASYAMLAPNHFRLIPTGGTDPMTAFLRLADAIQARDRCRRVEALQRAVDEQPGAYDRYCRAMNTSAAQDAPVTQTLPKANL